MRQLKNMNTKMVVPVADESLFKRLLSLEQRRCERTGVPFALVLFNMDEIAQTLDVPSMHEIAGSLGRAMRETDITGWYQQHSKAGIILTALNGTNRATLQSTVLDRTESVLSSLLTPAQMQSIRISIHMFPEEGASGLDATFYFGQDESDTKRKSPATIKRAIDLMGSLTALIVLVPFFALIAVLIKATSRGPVFFRQTRIGQFGREFTFLKFRSMYVNNDPAIHKEYVQSLIAKKVDGAGGSFKIKNDPRVTSIGRFLRKSSLDELPQFINVLKGQMSLVGPRPPVLYEFEAYSLWHRRRILEAKPGITGEWQVHGRSRTTFDEMVRMDLRYIRNQSILLDLKLLLKTPLAVLTGNGAY